MDIRNWRATYDDGTTIIVKTAATDAEVVRRLAAVRGGASRHLISCYDVTDWLEIVEQSRT